MAGYLFLSVLQKIQTVTNPGLKSPPGFSPGISQNQPLNHFPLVSVYGYPVQAEIAPL